jgi:hypothetical protein
MILGMVRGEHWAVPSQVNSTFPGFVAYAPGHTVLETLAVARDIHNQYLWMPWGLIYGQLGHAPP